MRQIASIVLSFSAANAAFSREPGQFFLLAGGQYIAPARATADLGVRFATKESYRGHGAGYGFLAEGGLGQGCAQYSAETGGIPDIGGVGGWTYACNEPYVCIALRHRAWLKAYRWRGWPDDMAYFRVNAGVARRVGAG
jgi:hypothetical protein